MIRESFIKRPLFFVLIMVKKYTALATEEPDDSESLDEEEITVSKTEPSFLSKTVYAAVGITALIGVLRLGPLDLGRTVYNQIIGDMPVLKRQLVDTFRNNYALREVGVLIINEEIQLGVERGLALLLAAELRDNKVDPQTASIEKLWDVAEDYAPSFYGRWVWQQLK